MDNLGLILKNTNYEPVKIFKKYINFLNIVVIAIIFALPYWFFGKDYFIGGDDSHLYFLYPDLWIKNIGFYSWFTASNVGLHNPQQFILPLLTIIYLLKLIWSPLIVFNFLIALPLVLGFIYFQKMIAALIEEYLARDTVLTAGFLGAIIYIFSPILWSLIIPGFLYCIWIIPLLPILILQFTKFYKTKKLIYVFYAGLYSIIFSVAFIAIPWFLGALIPIAFAILVSIFLFPYKAIIKLIGYGLFYSVSILLLQAFWLAPFLMTFVDKSWSITASALASNVQDSFSPTVIATMSNNNILYPVLNLFHRSIVMDFRWQNLTEVFNSHFDKLLLLNLIYLLLIIIASILIKKINNNNFKKLYFLIFCSWIFIAFLFTVNIGPLKEIFLLIKFIPGAGMFRNAFDKFNIGFVFIFAALISFSIAVIIENFRKKIGKIYLILFGIIILLTIINCWPLNKIMNPPLSSIKKYTTVTKLSNEYIEFIGNINDSKTARNKIFNLPFALPAYVILPSDENPKKVYIGASPMMVLGDRIDIPGFLSFPLDSEERQLLYRSVMDDDVDEVKKILTNLNVGYFLVNKNIQGEIYNSYIFSDYLQQQVFNKKLEHIVKNNFIGNKLLVSSNGNHELYESRILTSTIEGQNITYKKISPVEYAIKISLHSDSERILFKQSFNLGWKLYPRKKEEFIDCTARAIGGSTECFSKTKLFSFSELSYFQNNFLEFDHSRGPGDLNNLWTLRKKILNESALKINNREDDPIYLSLYFYPQIYFYIGILISLICLLILLIAALLDNNVKFKKINNLNS